MKRNISNVESRHKTLKMRWKLLSRNQLDLIKTFMKENFLLIIKRHNTGTETKTLMDLLILVPKVWMNQPQMDHQRNNLIRKKLFLVQERQEEHVRLLEHLCLLHLKRNNLLQSKINRKSNTSCLKRLFFSSKRG